MDYDDLYQRMQETVHWRKDIYRFLRREKMNEAACEIGVAKGKNLVNIVKNGDIRMTIGIDVWRKTPDNPWWSQATLDRYYMKALKMRDGLVKDGKMVLLVRENSHSYVNRLYADMFDLVYIDADHRYEFVRRDIEDWHSKVKIGGILAGHDYTNLKHQWGVIQAVDEFRKEHKVKYFHTTKDRDTNWIILKDRPWTK